MHQRQSVATFNVNGIRAALRRGYGDWLEQAAPDVIALQEVRCPVEALPKGFPGRYHLTYDPGSYAGRSGVAVLTAQPPAAVRAWGAELYLRSPGEGGRRCTASVDVLARGLRSFADQGRYLEVDLADQPITVASLYLPKGGLPAHLQRPGNTRERPDGGARYDRKMRFLAAFGRQVEHSRRAARARGRDYLLVGDFNIAHTALDLTNWRTSAKVEGFLPEERAWLDELIGPRRLVDVVRALHPDTPGPNSWWSWLGTTFERDVGWRIDFQLATPRLARAAVSARVDRADTRERRVSDHAPVVVDFELAHGSS